MKIFGKIFRVAHCRSQEIGGGLICRKFKGAITAYVLPDRKIAARIVGSLIPPDIGAVGIGQKWIGRPEEFHHVGVCAIIGPGAESVEKGIQDIDVELQFEDSFRAVPFHIEIGEPVQVPRHQPESA